MSKDPRVFLAHILERTERILQYTASGQGDFLADQKTQDAVIRNLEVIGEAAKRIPDTYRTQHAEIPWRSLAALRDVLIHQYEGVSLPEVWQVVAVHLPRLRKAIVAILPPLDQLEREISGEDDDSSNE
ncbi:MAG: DUF86 domain-containing protein [Phycisphaerae bacterium]|nr:DUF86 domain-containing protein [Phycisphaerae bacterium]